RGTTWSPTRWCPRTRPALRARRPIRSATADEATGHGGHVVCSEGIGIDHLENTVALKILAVTSEAFPLAKTGGLGDAVSGMAGAVDAMGTDLTVMLPAYRGVRKRLA